MSQYTLYYAPETCARVSIYTMFEKGIDFDAKLVRFMAGDHKAPEYLEKHPQGKVPLLVDGDEAISENVALLTYLAKENPDKGILPFTGDTLHDCRILSDLAWCSSGLHPIVTRIRMPFFMCQVEGGPKGVYDIACEAMKPQFEVINKRLEGKTWLYDDTWSALDAYIFWVWFRVTGAGFDGSAYPHYAAHAKRMEERDAYKQMIALEDKANAKLEAQGMRFAPPPPPK